MKVDTTKYTYTVSLMLKIVETLASNNRFDISRKLLKNGQKDGFVEVTIETMIEILALIATIKSKSLRMSLIKKLEL